MPVLGDLEAQRLLSDRDLAIFNAEMQRQSKSVGIAYLLWFFLGWAGLHKFYLGKPWQGALYFGLTVVGYALFFGGFLSAMTGPSDSAASQTGVTEGARMSFVGILALAALGILMLWDLFTIPMQIGRREGVLREQLLRRLREPSASV